LYSLFFSFTGTGVSEPFGERIVIDFQLSYLYKIEHNISEYTSQLTRIYIRRFKRSIFSINIIYRRATNMRNVRVLRSNIITFSFWYAVTAMNSVSLNTYVRKVEYGNLMMSLALTRWKRGWYLCIEFNMV